MSADFWLGLVILPALVVAALLVWLLLSLATWAWKHLHWALLQRVNVDTNRLKVYGHDDRPQYIDAANRFRDSLLMAPRFYTLTGLGWMLLLVRDSRPSASSTGADS